MLLTVVDEVPKADTKIHIHESSASTVATSITATKPAVSASEKETSSEMLNSFAASGKAVEKVNEIEVHNATQVTILSPDTPKEARLYAARGENNSQNRSEHNLLLKVGKSSIHDLSASTSIRPSITNGSRYNASEGKKRFDDKRGAVVKQEDQIKLQLSRLVRGNCSLIHFSLITNAF